MTTKPRKAVSTTKRTSRPKPKPTTKISSANEWKSGTQGVPITVPSGKTCLARRVDLRSMLTTGTIPNGLLPIIQEAIDGKPMDLEKEGAAILGDLSKLQEVLDMTDQVVVSSVIEPTVVPVPLDDEGNVIPMNLREDGDFVYVDVIDIEDKMFIFNWSVGGSRDLERFRKESSEIVADLPAVQGVGSNAK